MKKKKTVFIYCFCLLTATMILLFCSQNSPLYPMNDWVDVNAFFTVGKGMMNGLVPYKNLFEQKGPILYLIYGLGYLITNQSFLGVFIIECLLQSICLFYAYKIIKLFIDEKYAFLILPIMFTTICTCNSFAHGGSAEEICFPFFMISLYYFLNYLKNKEMNSKIIFINGFLAGIIFLIKYNLCGFWLSWMMFIFFDYMFQKKFKEGFKYCFIFLFGMGIPFLLFSIYFLINNGLKEFIYTYFFVNITKYRTNNDYSLLQKLFSSIGIFINTIFNINNILLFILLIIFILFIILSIKNINNKIYLFLTFLISIIFTFIGGQNYSYYSLLLILFFTLLAWIQLFKTFDHFLPKIKNFKYSFLLIIPVSISCIYFSYTRANYRTLLLTPKKELAQYMFRDIILKDKDTTLLNYGFLDLGVYFTTNQNPTIKHFEIQNLSYELYPYNWDGQNICIRDKCVNYVVMVSKLDQTALENSGQFIVENYQIIASKHQKEDYKDTNYYLLKRK